MTRSVTPEGARTFRAPSGLVFVIVSVVVAVFLLGDAVLRAGWGQMLLLAPWLLLGLWVIYQLCAASTVRVDDDGAVVQNFLRRTAFGWHRVQDIDLRWQLEFSLEDGTKVSAYGGPARSRPVRTRGADSETPKVPAGIRELTAIRDRWEAAAGAPASAPIRRSWDARALIALIVIILWAAASVVIAGS